MSGRQFGNHGRTSGPGVSTSQTLIQLKIISLALTIGAIVTSSMDGARYNYISTYVVMGCGFLTFAFFIIPGIVAKRQNRVSSSYYFPVVLCAWLLAALWIGLCGFLGSITYRTMHHVDSSKDDVLPMQMWLGVTLALGGVQVAVLLGVAWLTEKEWKRIRYPDPFLPRVAHMR